MYCLVKGRNFRYKCSKKKPQQFYTPYFSTCRTPTVETEGREIEYYNDLKLVL